MGRDHSPSLFSKLNSHFILSDVKYCYIMLRLSITFKNGPTKLIMNFHTQLHSIEPKISLVVNTYAHYHIRNQFVVRLSVQVWKTGTGKIGIRGRTEVWWVESRHQKRLVIVLLCCTDFFLIGELPNGKWYYCKKLDLILMIWTIDTGPFRKFIRMRNENFLRFSQFGFWQMVLLRLLVWLAPKFLKLW